MAADNAKPSQSNPVKRIRWATQRVSGRKASQKRRSIFNRHAARQSSLEKKRESGATDLEASQQGEAAPPADDEDAPNGRTIYFNSPLPQHMRDEEGRPLQRYKRNKIRTTKYTPLSFVPKNLWNQFHNNVANIYFLFLIILCFFSIFGSSNPGLNAVPLIVIVIITAVKDAIEDWRRMILDNDLNNAPVHRLVDWENVNTAQERVSPWRKFKKATTHTVVTVWTSMTRKSDKSKKKPSTAAEDVTPARPSVSDRRMSALTQRLDEEEAAEFADGDVEMTPVPSPTPRPDPMGDTLLNQDGEAVLELENRAEHKGDLRQNLTVPVDHGHLDVKGPPKRFYGSLINPNIEAPETARFKRDNWKSVQVGDFVRLYNEEEIPADVVVLATSDPDGACYVETKNLDGETNLKVRTALHSGRQVKRARDCERTQFTLESEPPHANLYAYSGAVRWLQHDPKHPDHAPREMAEPVGINNLLLRGCTLRNTEWIVGVVVFTGDDTKIMLNSGITPTKRANLSKNLNWNVAYNFILLFCMCLVAAVVQGTTWGKGHESLDYFEFGSYGGTPAMNGFITFFAAIILFQNLVPISLYISLEIIRTAQAFFIYSDSYMYYAKIDYPCTPKTWNISDDLGQIEYIFSDKTGTLTQNVMEFKKCTVNGQPYGEAYTEALAGMQKRQGIDTEAEGARARAQIEKDRLLMIEKAREMHNNQYLQDDQLTFVAPNYIDDLAGGSGEAQRAACERFMLALALCHTVLIERAPGEPPHLEFKAQSPDEAALVATARDVGFTVLGRTDEGIVVNCLGEEREYTVLNTLEFNSTRKRMSAIVRMPDGKIILFCKGADSIIYSRLKKGEQAELRKTTAEHLEMFAREGLRTLCVAQRELDPEEYRLWNIDHDIAAAAVQDRDDKLDAISDAVERDLTLLGGTAIEDRLQDGVPEAIQLLAQAGIKLWVLTGDKVETAINIGFSCNLLDNAMDLIVLKVDNEDLDQAEEELDKYLLAFGQTGSDAELKAAKKNHEAPPPTHALVIDGDTLKLVLDERMRQKFLLLCKNCRSVLCCRVSPSQKAAVVSMVKNGLDVMTLSIGDGANDVAMIQEADVGVGIAGEEGRQAAMSSDYAIGQFRFLTRLMLVHGRWSYRRLAEMIPNFFYKNIVWVFAIFWYEIYTNMDCSYAFDYTYILLYNLAFTSLPVIFMGILDQDVDDKVSLAMPQLYRRGIERLEWTQTKFWTYMFDGLYQSVIVFYFSYLEFYLATATTETGQGVNDYKRFGVYILTPSVVVVNLYILLNTYRWDWFMLLMVAISILLIFFWTGVYTAFTDGFTFYEAAPQVYGQLSFWAVGLLAIIMCLLPRFAAKAFQKIYMPRDIDIIREQVKQGKFDYLKDVEPDEIKAPPHSDQDLDSATSSEMSKSNGRKSSHHPTMSEDRRPFYPPSVTATATTHNPRSQNGSDGTDYTGHRSSLDRAYPPAPSWQTPTSPTTPTITQTDQLGENVRPSYDRPRPSFDRLRSSMDRTRPSFEASHDFTSAAYLSRVESSQSQGGHGDAKSSRRNDISDQLR